MIKICSIPQVTNKLNSKGKEEGLAKFKNSKKFQTHRKPKLKLNKNVLNRRKKIKHSIRWTPNSQDTKKHKLKKNHNHKSKLKLRNSNSKLA